MHLGHIRGSFFELNDYLEAGTISSALQIGKHGENRQIFKQSSVPLKEDLEPRSRTQFPISDAFLLANQPDKIATSSFS
ncbi:MAG TPA: hypothetical protein DIV79_05425 [Opitutae bacterium]|nr:hypothetical protein [Opitutae bacterium]